MQLATNYLGHFELTLGLHPALAAAGDARIVSVSSSGHLFSPVLSDDASSTVVVPLAPAGWATLYGMVTDRFGVTWVLDVLAPYEG